MLFCAGTIEAFVSPHAPLEVRVAVAAVSLVLMVLWFGFGGRGAQNIESSTSIDPVGP
ncbi:MAG: hypothetical protein IPJ19_00820 [Planctomycetes bacterium]|nr:hypothetical protein [Planctomycetota bacterium]